MRRGTAEKLGVAAASFLAGAALGGVGVASAKPQLPTVVQLGDYSFVDHTDLATRIMTVVGEGAQFRPQFINQGFELGGAHYIWAYYWPFNNPGEVTVDIGMIADLWVRPGNVWAVEIADFDLAEKVVTFQDTIGHRAVISLFQTAFLDLTQV